MELNLMRLLAEKQESNEEVALVTIISSDDVKSYTPGTMILVDRNGDLLCGGIGSESLEEKIKRESRLCIRRGLSRKTQINVEDIIIEVFTNSFCSNDRLIIAGSGDVAWNIYKFARILGYKLIIVDNNTETLTNERFPEAENLLSGDIAETLSSCEITEDTSIVIATHHHQFDEPALKAVIASPARYIGMICNARDVTAFYDKLRAVNIPEELISKVHSPIGLNIGGKKTAEIALSAISEIQAIKYGCSGGFISKKPVKE